MNEQRMDLFNEPVNGLLDHNLFLSEKIIQIVCE